MKRTIIFLFMGIFISLASLSNAQQFWIEKWTGSTAQGQITYSGPNGAWSVVRSGANGADSNVWYFSNWEEGMGRGQCGAGQTGPASAHMGFTRKSPLMWPLYQTFNSATNPDQGAVIDDDSPDPTNTNLRLQSPLINCTGKTNITLSFNYIEGKADGTTAEATVMYSSNGGTTWSLLATPPELDSCTNWEGNWTYYSVPLPASANGNANVKIGFNWTNGMLEHDDSIFDNTTIPVVSFAVDSIALSTVSSAAPVANFSANDTSICIGDTVRFTDMSTNSPTSWKWTFENGTPANSTLQDPVIVYHTAGYDSVKLVVKNGSGSDSLTIKKYIHVKNCGLGISGIADNNTINLYPNPANNTINLEFANSIGENAKVDITDITGRLVSTQILNASSGKIIAINISGIATGMYIVKITAGTNVYVEKFIKQ